MRYYHVLPESYHPGEDIVTFHELERMGRRPEWKWGEIDSEKNLVALFRHYSHAAFHRKEHGGTIYVIDLPPEFEREHVHENKEGVDSVADRIPARYVMGPSDENGDPCH